MKATSKLISVVLILALCLSIFTISAFAENTVITAPLENGKVVGNSYRGSAAGQTDPDTIVLDDVMKDNQDNDVVPEAPTSDGFSDVATAEELQAALNSNTANIRLTEQIEWVGVLNLDYNVAIDLGGKGKGLVFAGSGDAAIVSSANVELFNGNVFVSGSSVNENGVTAPGFLTVADSVDDGTVYLHGVYVKFTEAGENSIFGDGIRLGNGTFSQNVSKYYAEGDLDENYVVDDKTAEGGMFDVTAKDAVQPATDEGDDDSGDEDENVDGKVVSLTGVYGEGADKIVVTVSGKNLPEGLRVEVLPMDNSALQVGDDQEVLFVVDITLYDENDEVYEPADDPNVPEVNVTIRHPALGNVEEGEEVTLYHIVKGAAVPVTEPEEVAGQDSMGFSTDSFSPYGAAKATSTGSSGDVHYRVVTLDAQEIAYTGSDLVIKYSGKMPPEKISLMPYEIATSGDYDMYVAYLLEYGKKGSEIDFVLTDDKTITIKKEALVTAPDGKYGIVFWYMDGSSRVYLIQPVILVTTQEVEGVGDNFTPTTFGNNSSGTFDVEMCDANSVKVKLSDELKEFTISNAKFGSVTIDASAKKVTIDGKTYHTSELYSVEDYHAADPVGHDFVAGKLFTLTQNMLKLIDFRDGVKLNVTQKNGKTGDFTLNITPGITVADGLDDYIKGKNLWVKFQACAPIDYDADGTLAIWIGGQKISHDYYSISNDHQTLWIYRNLLDQLKSNNRYTLTARLWAFRNDPVTGEKYKETWYPATASFNVLAAGSTSSKSPKTGDESNIALWASVLVLSGGAVVALIPKKKKSGVK